MPLAEATGVPFEQAMPVRRFTAHRGQRHLSGLWWSATTGGHVGFESWLERDHLLALDFDPAVTGIASQPFWLHWTSGGGGRVSHAPDYFARRAYGSAVVVDCRPAERRKRADMEKFGATAKACALAGWEYELRGAPDPVVTANLRWLAGYRHPRHRVPGMAAVLREAFAAPAPLMSGASAAGDPVATLPGRTTFYKVIDAVVVGRHTFGSAVTRRQAANRPQGVFTPSFAARPGEQVQIDSTPIDVLVWLEDGVPARADLTIAVDVATRTICAAVLRPAWTKAVDAALLLARMLVPEPMRPGWAAALAMSASWLPHARLLGIDARMELAAARPVIVPDTIVIDGGKAFVRDVHPRLRAARHLGTAGPPAHRHRQADRGGDVWLGQHVVLPACGGLYRLQPDAARRGCDRGVDAARVAGPVG